MRLKNLSKNSQISEYLSNVIKDVICQVGVNKIATIISNNAANVANARQITTDKYSSIINVRCIAHCINLISSDNIKVKQVKSLVR